MAEQAADQRALAHAVAPEQADGFAAPDLQVDAVKDMAGAVPGVDWTPRASALDSAPCPVQFPEQILFSRSRVTPSEALESNRAAIRGVVAAHRAHNARVFGSVLRGEDTAHSDLDILIDPTPETTLLDIGAIRHELGMLLGVAVDVLTPDALPDKFRAEVLAEARPL
jgi:predicted nucleotidyltransferase